MLMHYKNYQRGANETVGVSLRSFDIRGGRITSLDDIFCYSGCPIRSEVGGQGCLAVFNEFQNRL